jgi:Mg-chelatase subunit ChlD
MSDDRTRRVRWRLVLGSGSEGCLGGLPGGEWQERDDCLSFLYDREYGAGRNVRGGPKGPGSLDESQLTVPDWINNVHELFPQRTIERIEKDALERYGLEEMVTNPDVLNRAQPNQTLLKAVLRTKHLMNQEVLAAARRLVRRVVDQLMERLAREIRSPFLGTIDRRRRSHLKVAKNFDARTTIRRNLRHYDPESRRLFIRTPYFYSRVRRHVDRWQIIILVDQSGSMAGSVIHAAVTASIFFGIKSLRTHLVVFDTSVVDLTDDCSDPVETLMKVQLGGGTDIGGALSYAATLVENPRRTIVVLITDFCEGAPENRLLSVVKQLTESGVTLLGLAALDEAAYPAYDQEMAKRIVRLGGHVAAMTPGELADWVAEKVK